MIKEITPAPMNTMLAQEPRDEAIKTHEERKKMITKDVPPTAGKIFSCKIFSARSICGECNTPIF